MKTLHSLVCRQGRATHHTNVTQRQLEVHNGVLSRTAMKVPVQQILRGPKRKRRGPMSVNQILRAAYRRFTRDKHIRQAIDIHLRESDL
jgi:hypothetical protein